MDQPPESSLRLRVSIQGAVQGVGFRPFVYRLATELGLRGWVLNSAQGVFIEAEGAKPALDEFLVRLQRERPPQARIWSLESVVLAAAGYAGFEIRHSETVGEKTTTVLPEIATCEDCLREIHDPTDRHFRYPFTNCTNCGPRFSIIRELPYDRANTSMAAFGMCPDCQRKYEDPGDRRFHAQPTACPACGPQLSLWDEDGHVLAERDEALRRAADAIRAGQIVALKGLGGFLLLVNARDEEAVRRLRSRKLREEKPFALMMPSLTQARQYCRISPLEERLLTSGERPIVLLARKGEKGTAGAEEGTLLRQGYGGRSSPAEEKPSSLGTEERGTAPFARDGCDPERGGKGAVPGGAKSAVPTSALVGVAPGNPTLGVMLPYSPLHHLLMEELGFPVVATSGNRTDEPIVTDEREALRRLRGIADLFLVHDRPIVRHCDDSVVRVMVGREMVLRRARGYAPLPVYLKRSLPPLLAVGAHLKSAVAVSVGERVIISQHIGDLETPQAYEALVAAAEDLQRLYDLKPVAVACDMHPDYSSTRYAKGLGLPVIEVQHHHAHLASCLAENQTDGPALGVCWDGTGYGPDGTLWGGEFLLGDAAGYERVAHFLPLPLPGGEKAIREPRRLALAALSAVLGEVAFDQHGLQAVDSFTDGERALLAQMLRTGTNTPLSCGVGRLFDAVAALIGLRQTASYEGQPAMELEWLADPNERGAYELAIVESSPMVVDWRPMIAAVLDDLRRGEARAAIAARFHNGLISLAGRIAGMLTVQRVALSGGVFQNRLLTEGIFRALSSRGHDVLTHQRVPPNDGGICLGQLCVAAGQIAGDARGATGERC